MSRKPLAEAALLAKINQGIPTEIRQRYHELIAHRRSETLTPAEHAELIHLSDRHEERRAERLNDASQFAQLRGIPFDATVKQLGIIPRPL